MFTSRSFRLRFCSMPGKGMRHDAVIVKQTHVMPHFSEVKHFILKIE